MSHDKKPLNIKVDIEVKSDFDAKRTVLEMTQEQYLVYLMSLDNQIVSLTKNKAFKDILNAAEKQNVSVENFIIDACKTAMARAEIVRECPADKKISDYVNGLIQANEQAQNWFEKVEITQVKIASATGCNRPAIAKFLKENKDRLQAHYEACGIENDHNRKVFNYERKQGKAG
jgi:hypothetical protein